MRSLTESSGTVYRHTELQLGSLSVMAEAPSANESTAIFLRETRGSYTSFRGLGVQPVEHEGRREVREVEGELRDASSASR